MSSPECSVTVPAGVRVERVDDGPDHEFAACDAHGVRVHRITGAAAARLGSVWQVDGAAAVADDAVTAALVEAGVLQYRNQDAGFDTMSRRRALSLAGGAAAVGVTTLLLPSAAAAASVSGPDGVGSPGTLTVSVFAGSGVNAADNRQFSIYWAWDGGTAGSPYTYTIDPGITRIDSSVTAGGTVGFDIGLQFSYPVASNSGSRVVTATWFGQTRTVTIPDITVVSGPFTDTGS